MPNRQSGLILVTLLLISGTVQATATCNDLPSASSDNACPRHAGALQHATAGLMLDIGPILRALGRAPEPADSARHGDAPTSLPALVGSDAGPGHRIRLPNGLSLAVTRHPGKPSTDVFAPADAKTGSATSTTLDIRSNDVLARSTKGSTDGALLTLSSDSRLTLLSREPTLSATQGTATVTAVRLNSNARFAFAQSGSSAALSVAGVLDKPLADDTDEVIDQGRLTIATDLNHRGDWLRADETRVTLGDSTLNIAASFDLGAGATFNNTINHPSGDIQTPPSSSRVATVTAGSRINLTVATDGAEQLADPVDPTLPEQIAMPHPTQTRSPARRRHAGGNTVAITANIKATLTRSASSDGQVARLPQNPTAPNRAVVQPALTGLRTAPDIAAAVQNLSPAVSQAMNGDGSAARNAALLTVDIGLADWRLPRGLLGRLVFGEGYQDVSLWAKGFGKRVGRQDDDSAPGYISDTAGAALGGKLALSDTLLVGAEMSYAALNATTTNTDALGFGSYQTSIHASYQRDWLSVGSSIAIARNLFDRGGAAPVEHPGNGRFFGRQWSSSATLSRAFLLESGAQLRPHAGLGFTQLALRERNSADNAAQAEISQSHEFIRAQVGASLRWDHRAAGVRYRPELRATLSHDFGDIEPVDVARFTAGGPSLINRGTSATRDSLTLGAALGIFARKQLDVRASYDFAYKRDTRSHAAKLVARLAF